MKVQDINPGSEMALPNAEGWRWLWTFKRDVTFIPNPSKGEELATIPEVETDSGILFTIFIAYNHGDALVGRQRTFTISKDPRLVMGYMILTKQSNNEKVLRRKLDDLIAPLATEIGKDLLQGGN